MLKIIFANATALMLMATPAIAADAGAATGSAAQVQVRVGATEAPSASLRVQAGPGGVWTVQPLPPPVQLGEYLLGIQCTAADDTLRAQLNLTEGQGLVVGEVAADGPAAKAEIQPNDVLVKAGDKSLMGVQDLIDAVQDAKDGELAISLIRGGKPTTVVVTPVKRDAIAWAENEAEQPREALRKLIESLDRPGLEAIRQRATEILEQTPPGQAPASPLRWRIFGPGTILPPDAPDALRLPENTSFSITRQGDEPAKITVRRGNQTWEATANELDKLPEDVRPFAKQMLDVATNGNLMGNIVGRYVPQEPRAEPQAEPRPDARLERLEKRLEDMNARIDQLRESIDQLRASRPRLRQAPGDADAPNEDAQEESDRP